MQQNYFFFLLYILLFIFPAPFIPDTLSQDFRLGFCGLQFQTVDNIRLAACFPILQSLHKSPFSHQWISAQFPKLSHRHDHLWKDNVLRLLLSHHQLTSQPPLTTLAEMRAETPSSALTKQQIWGSPNSHVGTTLT